MLPGVGNIYVSDGKVERPYFEVAGPRNVTYIVGHHAQLHCRVRHAGDRMVIIAHIFLMHSSRGQSLKTQSFMPAHIFKGSYIKSQRC